MAAAVVMTHFKHIKKFLLYALNYKLVPLELALLWSGGD